MFDFHQMDNGLVGYINGCWFDKFDLRLSLIWNLDWKSVRPQKLGDPGAPPTVCRHHDGGTFVLSFSSCN